MRRLTEAAGTAWGQLEFQMVTDLETAAQTPFADPVPDAHPLLPDQAAIIELDGAMVPFVNGDGAEARTLVVRSQRGETTKALSHGSQLAPAAQASFGSGTEATSEWFATTRGRCAEGRPAPC